MSRIKGMGLLAGLVMLAIWTGSARAADPTVENGMFNLRFHYQYFPTSSDLMHLRGQSRASQGPAL